MPHLIVHRLPAVWFGASLILMLALQRWAPVLEPLPGPWHLAIGAPLFVAGLVLAGIVVPLFRRHATTIIPFRESSQLIGRGPFRYSRNPIYLGMFVMLAGTACMLNALGAWFALAVFYAVIRFYFVRHEEAVLAQRFGDEYAEYRVQVRRWIGRRARGDSQ